MAGLGRAPAVNPAPRVGGLSISASDRSISYEGLPTTGMRTGRGDGSGDAAKPIAVGAMNGGRMPPGMN